MLPVKLHVPVVGSYNSADCQDSVSMLLEPPPATSTRPSSRSVAVCPTRPEFGLAVCVHVPVAGSYNSATSDEPTLPLPPTNSTLLLFRRVAVAPSSSLCVLPVKL